MNRELELEYVEKVTVSDAVLSLKSKHKKTITIVCASGTKRLWLQLELEYVEKHETNLWFIKRKSCNC